VELQLKANNREAHPSSLESTRPLPVLSPVFSPAPNYCYFGMTKIHASVLATVANNQMPLWGEEGLVYTLMAHGLLLIQKLLVLLPSPEDREL